jgi:hypothetical protein
MTGEYEFEPGMKLYDRDSSLQAFTVLEPMGKEVALESMTGCRVVYPSAFAARKLTPDPHAGNGLFGGNDT